MKRKAYLGIYSINKQIKTGMKTVLLQGHKINSFVLLLMITIFISPGTSDAFAEEQESAQGELKIEGSHIESLSLRRINDGYIETILQPTEISKLPVGEYQLQAVHLVGGYSCYASTQISGNDQIKITEDKQAVLKIGAPLMQTIEVRRQSRALVLNYKLLGIGGESYTNTNRSKTPSFVVYKGKKEIGSGQFEYG